MISGLLVHNDILYESTGLYGFSEARTISVPDGNVIERHALDEQYFGSSISANEYKGLNTSTM